ncbi:MAG: ABC transporter permease [Spirochaetia bacterium]|nr:ABC transporter permease [Spirochaetia bacterium]
MKYIYNILKETSLADFKKLQMQKFIITFVFIFIGIGLTTVTIIIFFDYKYSKIYNPSETLEVWHSALFQSIFTIAFAFAGSYNVCREYEKGMIKNIVLTGIPLQHYLFSRLIVFFGVFAAIMVLTYSIDAAALFIYFGHSFNINVTGKGMLLTLLHLMQTLFLVVMFSSIFKKTIYAIAGLLLYYMAIEKVIVKIIISMASYLNLSDWANAILQHTPLQVLDNLSNAFEMNQYLINFSLFTVYLCIYATIIWFSSRNTQLGLINK